ncbi:MAG: carboxylesterase family protein [Proteobacteria bacterium]|nr:carboxylesterase family protein [Pseudomonadota bacterium]
MAKKSKRELAVPASDLIETGSGLVSGLLEGSENAVRAYKGIPYAAAPVGELRWKPPRPVSWEGVRECREFGPACHQPPVLERMYNEPLGPVSEDCLFLNVWTPADTGQGRLPVMVWIHGGGFYLGSAIDSLTSGEALADQGAAVVSINYRLGIFGFFAHPQLSGESEHKASGNYGLLDQIFALQWIKDNISAFGGNPDCVTIFGESAGAASVALLMVSPPARGLFHRAITQSGSAYASFSHLRETLYGLEPAENQGIRIVNDFGIGKDQDPIATLRSMEAEELSQRSKPVLRGFIQGSGNVYTPVVDNRVIPDDPGELFENGRINQVPLMSGTNADEMTLFLVGLEITDEETYDKMLRQFFLGHSEAVKGLYPVENGDRIGAMNKILTDARMTAPTRSMVRAVSRNGEKSFLYYFTRSRPTRMGERLGAYHAAEIVYVFNQLHRQSAKSYNETDLDLARTMSRCWCQFAATGDPNGQDLPRWPSYDETSARHLELGDTVTTGSNLNAKACDLFEGITTRNRAGRTT